MLRCVLSSGVLRCVEERVGLLRNVVGSSWNMSVCLSAGVLPYVVEWSGLWWNASVCLSSGVLRCVVYCVGVCCRLSWGAFGICRRVMECVGFHKRAEALPLINIPIHATTHRHNLQHTDTFHTIPIHSATYRHIPQASRYIPQHTAALRMIRIPTHTTT